MTDQKELYIKLGNSLKDTVESQMFGKPCFKINGKAFICFFEDEMVFKLKADVHKNALALENAQLFDPSKKNRPMKEWVQVPFEHNGLWKKFASEAMKYVEELTKK